MDFPENSFDAVIMIEAPEHLPKELGYKILKRAEKWAKKKIIVSSPNGFVKQKAVGNNPLQKYLSGWNIVEMKKWVLGVMDWQSLNFYGKKCKMIPWVMIF